VLPGLKYAVHSFEADEYREAGHDVLEIAAEPGNMARVRNAILDYAEEMQSRLLMVDDDLRGVFQWCGGSSRGRKLSPDELEEFAGCSFLLAEEMGCYLWGMGLLHDRAGYRAFTPFSLTSVVLGPWTGVLPGSGIRYDEGLGLKEDYDFAIQNLNKHRRVLRMNAYFYKCGHMTEKGGCSAYRTIGVEARQFDDLQKKWGSAIVRGGEGQSIKARDARAKGVQKRAKAVDINPLIKVPIKGA